MPAVIVVQSLTSVTVDGTATGDLISTTRNFPALPASALLNAAKAWKADLVAQADAANTAQATALQGQITTLQGKVAEMQATIDTLKAQAIADLDAAKVLCQQKIDAKQATIDMLESVLGGTEAGQALIRQRRIAARAEKIAAATAEAERLRAEQEADETDAVATVAPATEVRADG